MMNNEDNAKMHSYHARHYVRSCQLILTSLISAFLTVKESKNVHCFTDLHTPSHAPARLGDEPYYLQAYLRGTSCEKQANNGVNKIAEVKTIINVRKLSRNRNQQSPVLTRSSAIAEGPRDASCQLKSCQLPRNSAEITYTTSPDQIDGMKLEI